MRHPASLLPPSSTNRKTVNFPRSSATTFRHSARKRSDFAVSIRAPEASAGERRKKNIRTITLMIAAKKHQTDMNQVR